MYFIIRVSGDYLLAVICCSPGGKADEAGATFLLYNMDPWRPEQTGDPQVFLKETTKEEVSKYFSGQADGLGFGEMPDGGFETTQTALEWLETKRKEFVLDALRKMKPPSFNEYLALFRHATPGTEITPEIREWLAKSYEGLYGIPVER